jgi:hypothetical protein
MTRPAIAEMPPMKTIWFAALSVAAWSATVAAEDTAPWWNEAWPARTGVVLPAATTGFVGVSLPAEVDPATVRVVAAGGKSPLPHWTQRITMSEPRLAAQQADAHLGFPRMVRAADGRVVLFYRAGSQHAADHSYIAVRDSRDDGRTWSDERRVWQDAPGTSAHNPVALVTPSGRIVLWISRYVYANPQGQERQSCLWCWSDDHGDTWSTPTRFDPSDERRCYYITDAIVTSDGLLAADATFPPDAPTCYAQAWHSADGGATWTVRSLITSPAESFGDEIGLLETEPGTILCLLRNRSQGGTFRLWSHDGGRTWTPREELRDELGVFQRPFLTRLDDRRILATGRDRERRYTVAYLSDDDGRTFGDRHVLEDYQGEGAYTAGVLTDDGRVLLTWFSDHGTTKSKPNIKVAELSIADRPTKLWVDVRDELPAGRALYVYHGNADAKRDETRTRAFVRPAEFTTGQLDAAAEARP